MSDKIPIYNGIAVIFGAPCYFTPERRKSAGLARLFHTASEQESALIMSVANNPESDFRRMEDCLRDVNGTWFPESDI